MIFGFTGILGKLISLESDILVWFRMAIASLSLGLYLLLKKRRIVITKKGIIQTVLTGFLIAAHWIFFFEAIKQSNVSITLATLSTASLFTALLEPIFFKRKLQLYELALGLLVILGLYFIFRFEIDNSFGILLALAAAFLASLFTVINGRLVKSYPSVIISFYELSGGVLAISLYFILINPINLSVIHIPFSDGVYLLILGIICTAFAFVASVKVMQELTPFTVSLSINLEPVYGIILALIFFGNEEKMTLGFYIGSLLIIGSILLNVLFKKIQKKRQLKLNSQ